MTIAGNEEGVTALCFDGQKYFRDEIPMEAEMRCIPVFDAAFSWLDDFFKGNDRSVDFPLCPHGTEFRTEVWSKLRKIPYGHTVTYGDISMELSSHRSGRMSARAVGNAVGRNPISIIIPCHRVIGAGGRLTGYAGGIDRKCALLQLEGAYSPAFR